MKYLFDLPLHTPTPAILYTFGIRYTKQRVDHKQLIYLHRILNQKKTQWTRRTLEKLENLNIGWYKNIKSTLEKYSLSTDFHTIEKMTNNEWKNRIKVAMERMNTERLRQDCQKNDQGTTIAKPKTAKIFEEISKPNYIRQPQPEILNCTKNETKTLVIARYGMLECGRNYKGTQSETCSLCNCLDNENHRLNFCPRWKETNLYNDHDKIDFEEIFSRDMGNVRKVINAICKVWNTENAHGTMYVE